MIRGLTIRNGGNAGEDRGSGLAVGGEGPSEASYLDVEHCTIESNFPPYAASCQYDGLLRLRHCIVRDNQGRLGTFLVAVPGSIELHRCVVTGNTAGLLVGLEGGTMSVVDSIVRGNSYQVSGLLGPWLLVRFSNIEGDLSGDGNIDADPLFVDSANGNYRLMPSSPCIDAGDPLSPLDADGSRADMGPFEFDYTGGGLFFCNGGSSALLACPCSNVGEPDSGCDMPQGTGGVRLDALAQESSPLNRVTLQGAGFPAMATPTAIVIRSGHLDPASPVVFGDGLRCVGVPLVRLGAYFAFGGRSVHIVGHGAMVGSGTFYYQLWFRSTPGSFCTPEAFNLSSGRTLVW